MAAAAIRRLCHWGPISVLCIIKLITWAMVHFIGMWWPPHSSLGAAIHAAVFLGLAASTLYYFLQSLLEGPGFLPPEWKPEIESDTRHLQFCSICNGYKAPRSHHCRQCGFCVKKMDHHCPWINCCVGHFNHGYFTYFLAAAVLGCLHATVVLSWCIWGALQRTRGTRLHVTLATLLLGLLAVGLALGVVLAVGTLCYFQIRCILSNRTTIEDWILEKAVYRREERGLPAFVFPYDVGWRRNLHLVVHAVNYDGVNWPVRDGCGKYDLTREQLAQKADKRRRAVQYVCVRPYGGAWLPVCGYPAAALRFVASCEPRLRLRPGDCASASRQRREWLFGELTSGGGVAGGGAGGGARGRVRGWFPRGCVVPADSLHDKSL